MTALRLCALFIVGMAIASLGIALGVGLELIGAPHTVSWIIAGGAIAIGIEIAWRCEVRWRHGRRK